mmetsp:Transcript_10782/g.21395  ORF Transcript_10782/g.21395 Transcript_10782/m.21395 type:complete len:108 (+) Transcript_10782:1121-1444(+)
MPDMLLSTNQNFNSPIFGQPTPAENRVSVSGALCSHGNSVLAKSPHTREDHQRAHPLVLPDQRCSSCLPDHHEGAYRSSLVASAVECLCGTAKSSGGDPSAAGPSDP